MATDVRSFFEQKYLGAWDVEGKKEVVLVIDRCEGGIIKGVGGKESKAPILYFRNVTDKAKGMILNKTNTKTIIKLYGKFIEDWPGKRISVYAGRTSMAGEDVDCLRIRPTEPPAPSEKRQREPGEEGELLSAAR